jgi:hypothetical protein
MRSIVLLALLSLVSPACTVDEEIVEGKRCYVGSSDPETTCMKGYECKCDLGQCICVKVEALGSPPPGQRVERWSDADPSRALLRRLGLTPPE